MACEHVCYPYKVRTGADPQKCKNMLRKHNAAYHQKCCTHKNTTVYYCLHNAERTVRALQLHNDFPVYFTAVACCTGLGNIAERKVCTDKRL